MHRVTRRVKLRITGGPSDRSVYFIPSKSCTAFVRRGTSAPVHRKGFMAPSKGVLKGRGKVVRCAMKRHGKLKLTLKCPTFMLRVHPRASRIIVKACRRSLARALHTGRLGFVDMRSVARPVQIFTGVHCGRGKT